MIFLKCFERLSIGVKKDFLLARIYGVFFSAFCFDLNNSQIVLNQLNLHEKIADSILLRSELYTVPYDRKVDILK